MDSHLNRYWGLFMVRGILSILLGIMALLVPGVTFTMLILLLGAYMFINGLFSIITSIVERKHVDGWGWFLISGLISIVIGILVLYNPFAWVIALVYVAAFWALVMGLIEIASAIRLRKRIKGEGWYIAVGVLTMLFGISLLINPLAGILTLTFVFAFYAIVHGIMLLSLSFRLRRRRTNYRVEPA